MDTAERPLTPPTTASDRPISSPFEESLARLAECASRGNIEELTDIAEADDLGVGICGEARELEDSSRLFVTAPLVLGYLIMDNLPPARYALTRLPLSVASHALAQALFGLLAAAWERKHTTVYLRSQELTDVVSAPAFFSQKLASLIRGLNERFIESFRERTFALISIAYTSIPLPLFQTYLGGLPVDKILSVTQEKGWSYDAATQTLSPIRPPGSHADRTGTYSLPSSLATINRIVSAAADLEMTL